jgi:hypothetical protein
MSAKRPHHVEPGPVMGKRRRLQLFCQRRVLDAVDLEDEEDRLGADIGQSLLDGLIKLRDLRVCHISGVNQLGIAANAPDKILQCVVGGHGFAKLFARGGCKLALPGGAKRLGIRGGFGDIGLQRGRAGALIEIAKIPLRQLAEVAGGGGRGQFIHLWNSIGSGKAGACLPI